MSATKVLLINDDEVAGMALAEVLGQSGFVVPVLLYHLTQIGFSGRWFAWKPCTRS